MAFAEEGADIAIAYLSEQEDDDAAHTADLVPGRRPSCRSAATWPNNFAGPWITPRPSSAAWMCWLTTSRPGGRSLTSPNSARSSGSGQPGSTFQLLLTTRAALKRLPDGGAIINTASINGLRGNKTLIDYAATKGAVLALTYSLAQALQDRGIRVNSVAPGPVWTPLIPATFNADPVGSFGERVPMGRAAHPDEIAPSFVFFASGRLSSCYSGEVLAPIGGETLPG